MVDAGSADARPSTSASRTLKCYESRALREHNGIQEHKVHKDFAALRRYRVFLDILITVPPPMVAKGACANTSMPTVSLQCETESCVQ
ncbi:hypothetical protein CYMTET_51620 [Cymbomonas tetramitiformis]|uniref:Uncharacterized protein n=1 Tax=Cymbomonas tetramitiformis TaxID=36881 RepID=A0AAE0BLV0_9CHLO|nr:hypothetical protein CYMTET_51620 [Cymbomonas tetramitiformis]